MAHATKTYIWHQQTVAADFSMVDCPKRDPIKDFKRDPSGAYVLIRLDRALRQIEVAVCDQKHCILKAFRGQTAEDVYEGIFQYEKKHRLQWFQSKGHIAYLGKELKKAELALAKPKNNYIQE